MANKISTEEFIKKARKVHNNYYDYSNVHYINAHTKISIVCPIHGEFLQEANSHIRGMKCISCSRDALRNLYVKTLEQFINDATTVHGNQYNYTNVNYINSHTKIKILCKMHGEFWQTPTDHLSGCNCPKCSNKYSGKTWFIEKANIIHNNFYDYSKVDYINNNTKVIIICPKHGEFLQIPHNHNRGQGCPKCKQEKLSKVRFSTLEIINRFKHIHGNKYNYSKVNYKGVDRSVTIICPKHGEFLQTPYKHLVGQGCPKCKLKGQSALLRILENKFSKIKWHWEWTDTWLNRQRIDIYSPEYKIAIEYDGLQHQIPVNIFGGISGFNHRQELDRLKESKCKVNNVHLIRVNYNYSDNDIITLFAKIEELLKNTDDRSKLIKSIK